MAGRGILSGYSPDFSEASVNGVLASANPMALDRMGMLRSALGEAAARYRVAQPGPDPTWFQDVGRGYGGDLGGMIGGLLAPPDLNTGDPMADGMNAASMFGMPAVGMMKAVKSPEAGAVTLYHGTTEAGAEGIRNSGKLNGPVFFSPSKAKAGGYGEHVVAAKVPRSALMIDADLPGGRLMTVDEANRYFHKEWTIDDYLSNGYSVATEQDVAINP